MSVFDFSDIHLTRHAKQVMAARDVSPEDLALVVKRPQIVEPSRDAWRFVRDDLCAVLYVDEGRATVVTVLLRRGDQWTDEDARER